MLLWARPQTSDTKGALHPPGRQPNFGRMIRSPSRACAALLLAAVSGPALAQTASAPTRLSGVTVTAPAPTLPAVVATYPADGKAVTAGVLILKVTFDQKMDPDGWDYGKGADAYPQCLDRPRLLADEKTFVLLCTVGLNGRYSVSLNRSASGAGGFQNRAGQKATAATVNFTTGDDLALANIPDAMKAAGLRPDEGPVMDAKPAATAAAAR
jgi:hypothetical protein